MLAEALNAQWMVAGYSEVGRTSVSEGVYLRAVPMVSYQLKSFEVQTAVQSDIISNNPNFISGCNVSLGDNFNLLNRAFNVQVFLLKIAPTELMRETNWGVLLSTRKEHFNAKIGTSSRTIGFSNKAIKEYNITSNTSVNENFNLMYLLSYDLKRSEKNWNIGATWTNFDHFLIYQETTPMINIHGYYKINKQARLFAEAWYKTSGALNLNVNYFGSSLRTGLIWNLK